MWWKKIHEIQITSWGISKGIIYASGSSNTMYQMVRIIMGSSRAEEAEGKREKLFFYFHGQRMCPYWGEFTAEVQKKRRTRSREICVHSVYSFQLGGTAIVKALRPEILVCSWSVADSRLGEKVWEHDGDFVKIMSIIQLLKGSWLLLWVR